MPGVDRRTGKPLDGWLHVAQSIEDIMTTRFGERIMREWYGSDVPKLLGELGTPDTFVKFYAATMRALTVREINGWLREPRFRITRFFVREVTRGGEASIEIHGLYIPRALYGDSTPEGPRVITVRPGGGIAGVV